MIEVPKTCCICNKKIEGWGNNPWPIVTDDGAVCCDDCNALYVLPARLAQISGLGVSRPDE